MSILQKKTKECSVLESLRTAAPEAQLAAGYTDTLREILQQPGTWQETFDLLRSPAMQQRIAQARPPGPAPIVLTGSGSSIYIGECLAPLLQAGLGVPVQAIAAGNLLTHWRSVLPPGPGLLISVARSGDSPESGGVVSMLLEQAPAWRHLVLTCNADGKLATHYRDEPRVSVLVLDARTNDRSLVMTSSFTNLLLAGTALLQGTTAATTASAVSGAAAAAQGIFERHADAIAALAQRGFSSAVYLGSGAAFGAAREGALKMLEMTGGQVVTLAETFLGLRHGPMSFVHPQTVIVAMLSPDPAVRRYEADVLRELSRKQLGMAKLVIGDDVPADVLAPQDIAITTATADGAAAVLSGVAAAQLLAFFRCLQLGGKPDTPSEGVLTRVVEDFAIHGATP